jgi:hypothetical protein
MEEKLAKSKCTRRWKDRIKGYFKEIRYGILRLIHTAKYRDNCPVETVTEPWNKNLARFIILEII